VEEDELLRAARDVRGRAHAPYSRLRVGAAVRDAAGRIHVGANVENASYGLTLCAERAALAAAVAAGALARGITHVAVVTSAGHTPCGACRQVLRELAPDATVLIATPTGVVRRYRTADLLPDAFHAFEPDA
jgi:cytidine deaminase